MGVKKKNKVTEKIKVIRSSITKYRKPLYVSNTPHMDPPEIEKLSALMKDAKTYIEYGCGGSTKLATNYVDTIVSVENDGRFCNALKQSFANDDKGKKIIINHVSLGPSGKWGHPVFTFNTPAYKKRRDEYVSVLWDKLRAESGDNVQPDLILIDGRFRVACALYSLMQLPQESETIFFFHDFNTRPVHHGLKEYVDIIDEVNSALIFKKDPNISQAKLEEGFKKMGLNWR